MNIGSTEELDTKLRYLRLITEEKLAQIRALNEIAAARVLCKYAETSDTFKVKAGFSEGKALTAETVTEMSKVPGKETLYAMLAGELSQCIAGLARALNAVAEQKGADAPAEA